MKNKRKNYLINNFSKLNFKSKSNLIFADEYLFNLYEKKYLEKYNCYFINSIGIHENYNHKNIKVLKKKLGTYRRELTLQLNNYHKTKLSEKHWGYLIDYFLFILINSIQKETLLLKRIKKKYKNLWTENCYLNENFFNTKDLQKYMVENQQYPKLIRSIIAKEVGINIIKTKDKIDLKKNKSTKKNFLNIISYFIKPFFRIWIFVFKPTLILDGYFGLKNSLKIFFRSLGKVIFLPSRVFFYDQKFLFKINLELRNSLKVKEKDFIDKIFNLIVGKLFPLSYLEGFKTIKKQDSLFSKRIPKIGTCTNMITDDKFKLLSAEIIQNKGKLLSFQHGGNFGNEKMLFTDMLEKEYSSKRYLWTDAKGLGQHYMSKFKKISFSQIKNNDQILIFPTIIIYQDFIVSNLDKNNHPYLNQNYDFFKNLNQINKNKVLVKLFPDKNYENAKSVWQKKFNYSINFSKKQSPNINYYNSKLVVINDISTPLYELMFIGIPFIIISENKFNEFEKKFSKNLFLLEKLNILHRNPVKAARFVNKNYNKISEWWTKVSNDKIFLNFRKSLFVEKEDYINLITKELTKH